MIILTLEDLAANIEIVIYPKQASMLNEEVLQEGEICLVSGWVIKDGDEENPIFKLGFKDIELVSLDDVSGGTPIFLDLGSNSGKYNINALYDIVSTHPGDAPVFVKIQEQDHSVTLRFKEMVDYNIKSELVGLVSLWRTLNE